MGLAWRYFLFLLWFSYFLISAILLFTHGFLLTRLAQPLNATCFRYSPSCSLNQNQHLGSKLPDDQCNENLMNYLHDASHMCLPPKAKVILVIIDALRYDFTKYDGSISKPLPFQNKLPVINMLLDSNPTSTRLYKFIADPPTTTMQRLKALTTGSLPTFIDAGSNFATSEINEDNIIDQLLNHLGETVFLGDDTWVSLYPRRFKRTYPFPSFNVFDLDTVDNGIVNNLYTEIEKKDWNLLIAHFLGVDHCGHRFGPMHSEMARKLTEMNQVIHNIVESLDNSTILIVIGDHGMTSTGDHGGESDDEVTSAMFVHSKLKLVSTEHSFDNETIKQIDFVPTLCTILGIPIPYSNLGSLIMDALPISNTALPFSQWQIDLFAAWSNIQQMTTYIKQYATISETFSQEKLQKLYEKFALLNARVRTVSSEDAYKVFMRHAKDYKILMRQMCEEVWIQFDSFSMSRGLVLTFMAVFLIYMVVSGIPASQLPEIFTSSFIPCSYIMLFIAAVIASGCFYYNLSDNLLPTVYFTTGLVSIFMLAVLVIQNWEAISTHWYNLSKNRSVVDLLYRLIFLLSWCGLLSNSYIVEEGNLAMFLLISVTCLIVCNSGAKKTISFNSKLKTNWPKLKALALFLIIACLIRLSTLYGRCREEQRWCLQSPYGEGAKRALRSEKADYLISLVTVAVFVTATRNWLRACGNLSGYSLQVLLARYAPTVIVVAIGGFWVLHRLPQEAKSKITSGIQSDSLALVVYGSVIAGIGSIIVKPLCIQIIRTKDTSTQNQTVPHIFNKVKGLFNSTKAESDNLNVPIVCGLGTVYSATFTIIAVYLTLLIVLLLGDVVAPSAVLLYFSAALILVVTAMSRIEGGPNTVKVFDVPSAYILMWMLLSLYFFYGSGHQATFPNIPWEAAFIGNGGDFTNNYIPALLVIINSFGPYILMGVTLPLLCIVPFTFYVMFPSMFSKRHDEQNEIAHGEILLYERNGILFTSVFTISCRYILFHAVRIFTAMLAATIHCRHLMVWKIFAPKLIFEAVGLIVTLISVLGGFLLLILINFKVDRLLTDLNKKSR
ncbi:hypothetical protein PPYR_01284 [Photinus pyralis]|uniref:GPI ethanolamine phosphate transferase 3, catalytic subunit n=1 Tax=Photinus pyralis TaxID=7054 RepID=A0A1Y1K3G3_PHOPY|nr:GPI ethanolamine phosphate transferase 3 [Photinus pyralis]KAB0804314.1 hypothetical protein PPYR_01284 [Photinus pyralis]